MDGWISLDRKLEEHWIWKNAKYTRAWIHCLFRANYKDTKVLINGKIQLVPRGDFITSIHKFAEDVGMSNQEVRTFWRLLQEDEMIVKNSTKEATKLTICNYEYYQDTQQRDQQPGNKPTTTENKDNKGNNKKNTSEGPSDLSDKNDKSPDKTKSKIFQETEKCLPLALTLSRIVQSQKNMDITSHKRKSWANEIRKLVFSEEKVGYKRVEVALSWYRKNVGRPYVPVIESGISLRKKFTNLEAAMERDHSDRVKHGGAKAPEGHYDDKPTKIIEL